MSAVELQSSSEEDSANTALREQTEQRTSSLLQARSCALLQWEDATTACKHSTAFSSPATWDCGHFSNHLADSLQFVRLTSRPDSKGGSCQTLRLGLMHAGLDREGDFPDPGQPGQHQRLGSSSCTQSVDGAHNPAPADPSCEGAWILGSGLSRPISRPPCKRACLDVADYTISGKRSAALRIAEALQSKVGDGS